MVTVQGARPGSREDSRGGEGSDQKSRPKAGRGKANKGWSPPKDVSAVKRSADVPELSAQSGPQFEDSTVFEIVVPSEASSLEAAQLEMRLLTAVHRNKAAEFAEHLFESGRMRRANREQVVADLTMVVDESLNNMITHGMISFLPPKEAKLLTHRAGEVSEDDLTNLIASAADNLDALTAALEGQDSAGDVSARVRAEVDAALVDRSHPIHRFRGRVVFRIKDNSLLVLVTDNGRGMGSVSDYESEAERQTKEGSRFVWMGSAEKAGGRGSIAARIRGASGPFYREPSVQAETGKKRGYLLWYSLPLIDS